MNELKNIIAKMIESGNYSPRINGILNLVVEGKMNSIELNNYLTQQCISINDIKLEKEEIFNSRLYRGYIYIFRIFKRKI